jgi:4-hydroxybenzoate polyprenyltransferase
MTTVPVDAGSRARGWGRVRAAAADIRLAHSVFALPFALLGAFLARPRGAPWPAFGRQAAVVVLCMVFARTWAMLINRWADREIDARNPRTAGRAIPAGRLPAPQALRMALAAGGLFIAATSLFWFADRNPWPVALAVPVLAWIGLYSYTKRFTALCHLVLGAALAASPLAAAIAVNPAALWGGAAERSAALPLLAGMVLLWVAGFDIIYALQDVEVDRREGLSSLPARLGPARAAWVSRLFHAGAFALLALAARAEPRFGPVFGLSVALVGGLLIAEHVVLARRGLAGLDMAFFTLNGVVSCVLGAAGIVDLVVA